MYNAVFLLHLLADRSQMIIFNTVRTLAKDFKKIGARGKNRDLQKTLNTPNSNGIQK